MLLDKSNVFCLLFVCLLQFFLHSVVAQNAGNLNECGEVNNVNDIAGNNWDYKFYCPAGYECVDKICKNETSATVKSVVDRCNTNTSVCEKEISLDAYCGVAFTRSDNATYYFNCPYWGWGGRCSLTDQKCYVYNVQQTALITRCNLANQSIDDGECRASSCPTNLQCQNIAP